MSGILLSIALAGSPVLMAQAPAVGTPPAAVAQAPVIGLAELYRQALPNEARLKAAEAAHRASSEQLPLAQAQLRPNISASASRFKNRLDTTQPDLLGNDATTRDRYTSENRTISLRQPLYRPALTAAVRAARHAVRASEAQRDIEFPNFASRVGAAYFDVLQAEGQVRFAAELVRQLQLQLQAATASLRARSGTRTDVDEVQAQLDSALADQVDAEQFRISAAEQLSVLLAGKTARLEPLQLDRLHTIWGERDADLAAWQERARRNSAEIRMLLAQAATAQEEISRAQAGHKPTVDLVVQRSRSASENVTRINSAFDNTSAGLQLNLPIYAGGAVNAQVRQAVAEWEKATHLVEAAQADSDARVRKEHRAVVEALSRHRALQQAVASSQTALRSSERSFEAGVRTRVDIAQAAQRLAVNQRQVLQSAYSAMLSRLRLELLATGTEPEVEAAMQWMDRVLR